MVFCVSGFRPRSTHASMGVSDRMTASRRCCPSIRRPFVSKRIGSPLSCQSPFSMSGAYRWTTALRRGRLPVLCESIVLAMRGVMCLWVMVGISFMLPSMRPRDA